MIFTQTEITLFIKCQWILTHLSSFLAVTVLNVNHENMEQVLRNSREFLEQDLLTLKTKRRLFHLCNFTCILSILLLVWFILYNAVAPVMIEADYMSTIIYPFTMENSGGIVYLLALLAIVPSIISHLLTYYLPLVNICVTYIEIHILKNLNNAVEDAVKKHEMHQRPTELEDLRKKHICMIEKITEHNNSVKFLIAVFIGVFIAECCLSIYMLTTESSLIALNTVGEQMVFGFSTTVIFTWSGIRLNSLVRNILI